MLKTEDFYPPKDFSAQVHGLRSYIYEALGWSYRPNVGAPAILMALQAASMVHSLSGVFKFRGEVLGQGYKGQQFELVDVTAHSAPKAQARRQDWQWGGQKTEANKNLTPCLTRPIRIRAVGMRALFYPCRIILSF